MHNITFFEVKEQKEAYRSAVNNLLTQLSQNAKPMTIDGKRGHSDDFIVNAKKEQVAFVASCHIRHFVNGHRFGILR